MMLNLEHGWRMDLDHGPEWLFVRLHAPAGGDTGECDLAEAIWASLTKEFTYRLVLELDDVSVLKSSMIGAMVRLHKRIAARGGMMRLCGLSDSNQQVLRVNRLAGCFPNYNNRKAAVMGYRPALPR